ncbi:GNAT family N-acetyltransferase [Maribellus comscasis]|uniref:GNAT family N-acetyltransferase n=1 Tax=Maribellus comscasis TaxID=2681766 RepID=A0A6I6JSP2_9BACT|nr:GNAT family N-acetyltransferase [Maribellus comscasis]QGY43172.1 GNAT family N-acetyltransferase [Maribellus comscasis]
MANISADQTLFLGQFRLPVLYDFIPQAVANAAGIANVLHFNATESNKLQMAVEEAVKNVIDHYSTIVQSTDFIDIHYKVKDAYLVVSVFEKGIPFQQGKSNNYSLDRPYNAGLGMHMLNSLMDKVELIVHGRKGKETRLTKKISTDQIPDSLLALYDGRRRMQTRIRVKDYEIRRANKDNISDIVRLAWKCYGYTQEELLYDADSLAHQLNAEELVSFVVINKDDEALIAHLALKYHDKNVPEMGLAFIDPTYRCPGVMVELGSAAKQYAESQGADGIFDCAVTTHTVSQKELQEIGARPCTLMMGIAASGMQANMTGTNAQTKGTTVNHYNAFKYQDETVYSTEKHKDMIQSIYNWMEMPRVFGEPAIAAPGEKSEVFLVPLSESLNVAFIIVGQIGKETASEIIQNMHKCIMQKMDACYVFMSMQHPYSPVVVEECEKAGFSFCGIMPHIHNGEDRVMLQKVNVKLDKESIRVYSDESRELLDYVFDQLHLD